MSELSQILARPEGPERTAALAAWVQGLFDEPPVLIGGAVVELLTGGGYRTGDLDFAGTVSPEAASKLEAAGFERRGRHWTHQKGKVFLEFPAPAVDPSEGSVELVIGDQTVLVLAPEAVIVDRLAAWRHWRSTTDAVNAYLVWRATRAKLDRARLERLAREREVTVALERLDEFGRRFLSTDPSTEEVARWAETEF